MEMDMTKGSPFKLIVRFLIPIVIGNIFQQFYSMVDTVIVGRFVGVKALAAVGSTGTIMFLIIGFMQGLTTGFTVLTSQRFGAGDREGVKQSVGTAFLLSAIVTVAATGLSMLLMKPLLSLMNTPADIFEDAYVYIMIICAGMGTNILYNILASVLRAVGNSKVPLYFLIISAVSNILLDLFLIIVFKMGVAGAAVATVIAQGLSGVLCIIYIFKKVEILHVERHHLKLESQCVKNELTIGLPMALQFSITAVGAIMIQSALNMLGSTAIASYTAAGKSEQLLTQPFAAMGMTMATYGAQNRGVNDFARIRKGVRAAVLMTVVYGIVIAFVAVGGVRYMIDLFVSSPTEEIYEYAAVYMKICSLFFIPLGFIFLFRNVLQGMGLAFWPTMGGVVELFARGAVAMIAAHYLSYAGICMGNGMAWLTAGVILAIAYLLIMRKLTQRDEGRSGGLLPAGEDLLVEEAGEKPVGGVVQADHSV